MVYRNEILFKEIGERLRVVRLELKGTMDIFSKESGISRSYLSDFEKGYRMPTSKYLRYLYDRHNVNLNYIFGGVGWIFMNQDKTVNFGELQPVVNEMLVFLSEMPPALFSILEHVSEYKMKNKELIDKHRSATADREEKGKTG